MPNEYDFMKSSKEKEMPDEEYKTLRGEYDMKAEELSGRTKKILIAFFVVFAVSFVILYLLCLFNSEKNYGAGIGNYTWLVIEFLLAVFIYDPKAEETKKHKYETDKRILLNAVKSRITANKIKLGLVIGLGAVFLFLNGFCWWLAFMYLSSAGASGGELLKLLYMFFM